MSIVLWTNKQITIADAPHPLVALLTQHKSKPGEYVSEDSLTSFSELDTGSQERYRRYVKGVIASESERLSELAEFELPEWDNNTFHAACNIFEMAKAPWSPLSSQEAEQIIRDSAPPFDDEGWSESRLNRLIDSAYSRVFSNDHVRPYPEIKETKPTTPQNGTKPTEETELQPLKLIPASAIEIQKTEWLWDQRIALGEMSLLAGREGIGKSVISIWIAAQVSKGLLPGEFFGLPRNVLYLATEDSWNKTIAPRLLVAGANMDMVFREDLEEHESLYLPRDTARLALTVKAYEIALVVMDPLMSYVGAKANTYSGREVRSALEPIVKVCHDYNAALLGLIHFNKTSTDDILNKITDSKAFTQLTRTVTVVERDEEAEEKSRGIIDTVKNNLGRMDLPAISYKITGVEVMTNKGMSDAPVLEILGDVDTKVEDLIRESTSDLYRGQTKDAAEWLDEYLEENQNVVWAKDALKEGVRHDFKDQTLRRALKRLKGYKSQRMGGSTSGFAWFKTDMTREDALSILESRVNKSNMREQRRAQTNLEF